MIIREIQKSDFSQILWLIKELASFENEQDSVTNTLEQMRAEQDFFSWYVAENEAWILVWIAIYYFTYSTRVWKSLYLEDLYVKESLRWTWIGTKLVKKVFETAKKTSCNRVRRQVLDRNTPAIEYYKKLWAKIDTSRYNCDFNKQDIIKFT